MKKVLLLLTFLFVAFFSIAQQSGNKPANKDTSTFWEGFKFASDDDDNDGVPNNEDACPGTAGPKANKGCPYSNTSFITPAAFKSIFDMVVEENFEELVHPQAPKTGIRATTLPQTGKNQQFPVYVESHGQGAFDVLIILSDQVSDLNDARKEVLGLIAEANNNYEFSLLYLRQYKVEQISDTTVLLFGESVISDNYLEMSIRPMQSEPGKKIVLMGIRSIPNEILRENYNKQLQQASAEAQKNDPFCKQLQAVLARMKNYNFNNNDSKLKLSGDGLKYNYTNPYFSELSGETYYKTKYPFFSAKSALFNSRQEAESLFSQLISKSEQCIGIAAAVNLSVASIGLGFDISNEKGEKGEAVLRISTGYDLFSKKYSVSIDILSFTKSRNQTETEEYTSSSEFLNGKPSSSTAKAEVTQSVSLSEADKTLLIKNFQTILQQVPAKFDKLKTGEENWDITNRISWYKSTIFLCPNLSDKNQYCLSFGTYSGKPSVSYVERVPLDVKTIAEALLPTLMLKGMVEVNTKYVDYDPLARAFRNKDAVLLLNYIESKKSTDVYIGKIPYYYESDVKPLAAQKPKTPIVNEGLISKLPEQKTGGLTDEEKKLFAKNIVIVLAAAPVFSKLKTKTVSENSEGKNFTATVALFPHRLYDKGRYFVQEGHQMVYASQKENYYLEYTKANPEEFITVLEEELGKKGFEELEPKYRLNHFFFKVYRLQDLVVFVDKVGNTSDGTEIRVGKISYYNDNTVVLKRKLGADKSGVVSAKAYKNVEVVKNECTDMEAILNECLNGYKNSKGSFVKKETPASYYNTSLPAVGFEKKFVVESMNIDIQNGEFNRKPVVYYSAEQSFTSADEAMKMYDKVKVTIKKCFSGTVNTTDDKNQKIYELFTSYKGKEIRIALIYLNFFSSSVSVSVKLAD